MKTLIPLKSTAVLDGLRPNFQQVKSRYAGGLVRPAFTLMPLATSAPTFSMLVNFRNLLASRKMRQPALPPPHSPSDCWQMVWSRPITDRSRCGRGERWVALQKSP